MEKRSIVACAVVALAAGAAIVRALHPPASGASAPEAASRPIVFETGASGLQPSLASSRSAAAIARPSPIVVYVAGEVRRPGLYRLPPQSRADDALKAAGGASSGADPVAVNLAERLSDGEELVVPARGTSDTSGGIVSSGTLSGIGSRGSARRSSSLRRRHRTTSGTSHRGRRGRTQKPPPAAPVDVNSADAATLQTVPGIGPRLAERIVAFRQTNGAFASPDDLLDVRGVSDRLLEKIAPYVKFGR